MKMFPRDLIPSSMIRSKMLVVAKILGILALRRAFIYLLEDSDEIHIPEKIRASDTFFENH